MSTNEPGLFNDLEFDNVARAHIRGMAQWAMVIAILAVVGYVISLIQAFSAPALPAVSQSEGFSDIFMGLERESIPFTILSVAIGLLLNFFLYRFASQAKKGIDTHNGTELGQSFNSLKAYFMIYSILIIIVFVIVLLALAVGISQA